MDHKPAVACLLGCTINHEASQLLTPFISILDGASAYELVVGPNKPVHILPTFENRRKEIFYIEATEFPSSSFSGLISFSVSLIEKAHNQVCRLVGQSPWAWWRESDSA